MCAWSAGESSYTASFRVSASASRWSGPRSRAGSPVEVRTAAREVSAKSIHGLPSDRDDTLFAPLAEAADEPVLEVDGLAVEPDRLADAKSGAVEELAEGAVAEGSRRRARRRVEQAIYLGG